MQKPVFGGKLLTLRKFKFQVPVLNGTFVQSKKKTQSLALPLYGGFTAFYPTKLHACFNSRELHRCFDADFRAIFRVSTSLLHYFVWVWHLAWKYQ